MLRTGAFGLLLAYATAMPLLAGGLVLWALPVTDAQLRAAGLLGMPLFAALGGAALPFALVNVLLAVSPVSRPVYLAGTLVGMLPRTAAAVVAGAAARSALAALGEGTAAGDEGLVSRAALVLAVIATAGLAWYAVRAVRRAMMP
jgi:uncharacterized membrane protein YdjX (TVP38/TMEM64 family)